MLMPKRVKYRKTHRGRRNGKAYRGSSIAFGEFGLKAMQPAWVTSRQIEAARVAITRTIKRGGSVVIPAFAVDRTEVLLKALRSLQDQQRIPVAPIHVDSPMALAGMRVYRAAIADGDPEINSATIAQGPSSIDLKNLHEATTPQDSMALDRAGARQRVARCDGAGGVRRAVDAVCA